MRSSQKPARKKNLVSVLLFQLRFGRLANGPCAIFLKFQNGAIVAAHQTLQSFFDLDAQVAKAADLIEESLSSGKKLLVCGNGGSAADSSHFPTEFVVRFAKDRPAYPAICLSGDGGLLTAAGNDYASKKNATSVLGRAPLFGFA